MPTTVAETDAFIASLQRPNNGELADAASILLYLQHLSNSRRWLYNRSRSAMFDVTRAPYNADPTGATSSHTAIASAITAAAALGGDVFIPPGNYRINGLSIPGGVNIWGTSETYVYMDHATNNVVRLLGSSASGRLNVISDLHFFGNVAASGIGVLSDVDAKTIFQRCSWNGLDHGSPSPMLTGKIASVTASAAELTFVDCDIAVAGLLQGLHATAGKIHVVRGKLVMPATYAQALAMAETTGSVTLDNVYLDFSAHVSGVAQGLYAATADLASLCAMRGCEVYAGAATGTMQVFYWFADSNVVMQGNRLPTTGVVPFPQFAAPSSRSQVELPPYVQQDFSTSSTIDLRNTYGYRTHLVRNDDTSASIILPAGVLDGQELDFIYYNAGASGVMPTFATTLVTGRAPPTIAAGQTLGATFRWVKREASGDSDRWVQVSDWCIGSTLV